jgi:dihydrofolate reductase
MKISVFIATSLDGYIARPNGSIDWLLSFDTGGEDHGYKTFYESTDCLIIGRGCLETVMTFPEWPYEGQRVIVLSTTMAAVPSALVGKIQLYSGELRGLVKRLESEGCSHLYIDGGKLIQSFLNEGLVSELTITRIPIILGEGLPLFGKTTADIRLEHVSTRSYGNGFVQSLYKI